MENSRFWRAVHNTLVTALHVERRVDPFFRPAVDAVLREPAAAVLQFLINARRRDEGLRLAEEREQPNEQQFLESIICSMRDYMAKKYSPGNYQRAGNTKTHAILRGCFQISDNVPEHFRRGVFAAPGTYPAWVRFSGPGPESPPDIEDVGVLSFAMKLMGVPGPKLLDDETQTQDFLGISIPTFTTPDTRANARLQQWIGKGLPLFYFTEPRDTHLLDALMQGLWSKTQSNPLGERYWSCVPYLLGEGQAVKYAIYPRSRVYRRIPRLPLRPPDNYLRENIAKSVAASEAEFDFMVQPQTDAFRMPIENASVRWPERLSPFVPVARLTIARQMLTDAQMRFANNLSFNPWHCLPEHRPLGNQNRARLRLYEELSRFRQQMNGSPHTEPTGEETFS